MDRGRYNTYFRLSLILSIVLHIVILVVIRLPSGWVREEMGRHTSDILIFSLPEALPEHGRRAAVSAVDYTETMENLVPLTLRKARALEIPRRLSPPGLLPGQHLTWHDIMDLSSIKLLPPHYYERFAWQVPDTTRKRYSVNGLLQRALLDALLARQKKERFLVETALGEFGVTPGLLHLGPVTLPIPFAPYGSMASRTYLWQFEEIKSHETRVDIDDDELLRQRERIIEWKKRQGLDP